jgi:hypothetical protein
VLFQDEDLLDSEGEGSEMGKDEREGAEKKEGSELSEQGPRVGRK